VTRYVYNSESDYSVILYSYTITTISWPCAAAGRAVYSGIYGYYVLLGPRLHTRELHLERPEPAFRKRFD
jgi:hypothetical protein